MNKKPPKVLHLIDHLGTGGAQEIVNDLCKLLTEDFEPSVAYLFNKDQYHKQLESLGVKVYALWSNKTYTYFSALNPLPLIRLIRLVRRERFDIIQIHLYVAGVYSIFVKLFCPWVKIVNTVHVPKRGSPIPLYWAYRFVKYVTDFFVAEYESTITDLIGYGVKKERIGYIRFGTNIVDNFQQPTSFKDLRKDFNLAPDAPVLLSMSRLNSERHVYEFIQMWAELIRLLPRARFVIVGSGPEEERLKKLVADLNLGGSIYFAGWRNDMPDLFNLSACYITVFENTNPMSVAAIQAWVYGKPVTGYNIGDMSFQDIRKQHSFMTVSDDPKELAVHVAEILRDAAKAKESGEAGKVFVQAQYSMVYMCQQYRALYNSLLS